MTTMRTAWAVALTVLLAACGPVEHHARVGALEVALPWSREVPPHAPVAAGFMSIRNRGDADDRLVAVRSTAAREVQIHEVRHEDGVAHMRRLPDGLPLPAGATVALEPGGYHLMFIQPASRFRGGDRIPATLVFEHAGELEVTFEVRPLTQAAPDGAHHAH